MLDDPFVQFGRFVAGASRGDLGRSITVYPRTPIREIIAQKVPYRLWFGLAGIGISMSLGLWLGVAMARYKDGLVDGLGTAYVVLVRAVPSLIYLFFIQIGVSALFGLPMVFYEDRPESWILPGLSMSLSGLAWYAIWLRRFMVDEENKDYIKFAVAKGLPRGKIMGSHVLRNAIVPLVQALVLIYSTLGVFGVFLGDVLMALVDPRITLAAPGAGKKVA